MIWLIKTITEKSDNSLCHEGKESFIIHFVSLINGNKHSFLLDLEQSYYTL